MNKYLELEKTYLMPTYNRFPVCIKYAKGSRVYDMNEKEYLDFTSGIGVNSLGYADSKWVKAVSEQAGLLSHSSNLYYSLPMLQLAEKLCKKTKMKRVFFSNSGAESNEGAIKIARKYANHKYKGKRNKILSLINSFHGRTMMTLSATGQEIFHKDFEPFPSGFSYIKADEKEGLNRLLDETTAAIMIEVIQGEGGVVPLKYDWIQELSRICRAKDILLIVDEVQTGVGRTGYFCAYEAYDMKPDIVTLAKGLGGGLPIGAVLVSDKCKDVLTYGDHGSTFGGNPIACAGANVVLDSLDEVMMGEIRAKGAYIRKRLEKMSCVESVEGMGMMLGVRYKKEIDVKTLVLACLKKGALFLTAKDRLRLLPPLTISFQEIDKGLDILEYCLTEGEGRL